MQSTLDQYYYFIIISIFDKQVLAPSGEGESIIIIIIIIIVMLISLHGIQASWSTCQLCLLITSIRFHITLTDGL